MLLWILGQKAPASLNPARLVNEGFAAMSPESLLAAPIAASLILLGAVLLVVEAMQIGYRLMKQSRDIPTLRLSRPVTEL